MDLVCPCCFAKFSLEAGTEHSAAGEFNVLLAKLQPELAMPLIHYLGLFRTPKRAVPWSKTLDRAKALLELDEPQRLAQALAQCVTQMRKKQSAGSFKPLKNNAYLQTIIDELEPCTTAPVSKELAVKQAPSQAPAMKTATGKTMQKLQAMRDQA